MKRILVFVAHPDDEFLGCGATLLKLKKKVLKSKLFFGDGESSRKIHNNLVLNSIIRREKQAISFKEIKFEKPEFARLTDNRLDTVPILEIIKYIEKQKPINLK